MAQAYKCDGCSNYFEEKISHNRQILLDTGVCINTNLYFRREDDDSYSQSDLCSACEKELNIKLANKILKDYENASD